MLTLADVLEALTGVRPHGPDQVIPETVVDAGRVSPGSFFINLENDQTAGMAAVQLALVKGAELCMVAHPLPGSIDTIDLVKEPPPEKIGGPGSPVCLQVDDSMRSLRKIASFWRKKRNTRVVCVTGTVGKTTTKDLIAEILGQRYRTLKNYAQLPADIDLPLAILQLTSGNQRAVLEVKLQAIEDDPDLADLLSPNLTVITNIGSRETGFLMTEDQRAKKKQTLLRLLPPDGKVVANYDDPWMREWVKGTDYQAFSYGLNPQADLWADAVEGRGLEGIEFDLHYREGTVHIQIPMIGRHSVHSALRAAAVGLLEGLTWEEIIRALRFGQSQLRLVAVRAQNGALILDDTYNASPQSTLAALNLLEEMGGRKIAVLAGDPGMDLYDQQSVEMVGLRAAQIVSHLVTVGEHGARIAAAARSAWLPGSAITELPDAQTAVSFLKEVIAPADVVLIKGPRSLAMEKITRALEQNL